MTLVNVFKTMPISDFTLFDKEGAEAVILCARFPSARCSSPSGGPNKSDAKRQHINGREDGRRQKTGACLSRPHDSRFTN